MTEQELEDLAWFRSEEGHRAIMTSDRANEYYERLLQKEKMVNDEGK